MQFFVNQLVVVDLREAGDDANVVASLHVALGCLPLYDESFQRHLVVEALLGLKVWILQASNAPFLSNLP